MANVAMPWQYMNENVSARPPRFPSAPWMESKIFQTMLHIAGVGAFEMRVAAAEHGEQREAGDGGVGLGSGAAAIVAQGGSFVAGAVFLGVEMSVGLLMEREPLEGRLHGRFGFGRTAVAAEHRGAIARRAIFVDLRRRSGRRSRRGRRSQFRRRRANRHRRPPRRDSMVRFSLARRREISTRNRRCRSTNVPSTIGPRCRLAWRRLQRSAMNRAVGRIERRERIGAGRRDKRRKSRERRRGVALLGKSIGRDQRLTIRRKRGRFDVRRGNGLRRFGGIDRRGRLGVRRRPRNAAAAAGGESAVVLISATMSAGDRPKAASMRRRSFPEQAAAFGFRRWESIRIGPVRPRAERSARRRR